MLTMRSIPTVFTLLLVLIISLLVSSAASGTPKVSPALLSRGSLSVDFRWKQISEDLGDDYGKVIDSIIVRGNKATKSYVITREMATREGEELEREKLLRDYSYLKWMGIFSDVDFKVEDSGNNHCILIVNVVERPNLFMKYPYPVVNYDFKKGLSYGFNWKVKNFRGVGEEIGFSVLKRREIEEGAGLYWIMPWFVGKRIRFSTSINAYRRVEKPIGIEYIKSRYYTQFSFGLPLSRSLMRQLWLGMRLSIEERESVQRERDDLELKCYKQDFLLTGFSIYYDSRDNYVSPWRGTLISFDADFYNSFRGLRQSYTFYSFKHDLFVPVTRGISIISAFDLHVRDGDVAEFFRMGLGGSTDLRGYVNGNLEGDTKLLHTFQVKAHVFGPVIIPLPKIGKFDVTVSAVAFVDNGLLARHFDDIPDSQVYTTGGVGIELLSPLQDRIRFEVATGENGTAVFMVSSHSRF